MTMIPRARHSIWAQEAAAQSPRPEVFQHVRTDKATLAAILRHVRSLPKSERSAYLSSVLTEGDRIAARAALAAVPAACGSDMPVAPARGAVIEVATSQVVSDGEGGTRVEVAGYRGRSAMRAADALDRVAGLTPGQVQAGRDYGALVEAVASGGVKCSSSALLGGIGGGGGESARDFMDLFAAKADRLRRMNAAIGDGVGMPVRRVRPSARGSRVSIPDRGLVNMVCLQNQGLVPVLARYGWTNTGRNIQVIGRALAAVLERLREW